MNHKHLLPETDYKKCPYCAFGWRSRDDLLCDPGVELVGYQVFFSDLMSGAFLFNHTCGTTLAIHVDNFADLYEGPRYSERITGQDACPEYCLHKDELQSCPNKCDCAYVREILQIIKNWPKEAPPA